MFCFFFLFVSITPPRPPQNPKTSPCPEVSAQSQAHSEEFLGIDSVYRQLPTTLPTTFQSRLKENSHSVFPCLWKLALCWGKSLNSWRGSKRHLNEAANCFTCFCAGSSNPGHTCSTKMLVHEFPWVQGQAGRRESSQRSGMLHNPLKSFE